MQEKIIKGFPHTKGRTWQQGVAYALGEEVYGTYEDGSHHHLSCYRSLADNNTAELHDTTKWLAYCDGEDIAALIDKKIQDASMHLIDERLELTATIAGTVSEQFCTVTIVNEETKETIATRSMYWGQTEYFDIPPDMDYRLVWSGISGYAAPRSKVYHSYNANVRQVSARYDATPVGVYICTTERALYKAEDWQQQGTVKGIYVSDGSHTFVVAPTTASTYAQWAKQGAYEATHFLPEDQSRVREASWMGGLEDCEYYKANCTVGDMPALEFCVNYQWADGNDETSYLPAIGELVLCSGNATEIDAALVAAGYEAMQVRVGVWWSSSQGSSATYTWLLTSGSVMNFNRTSKYGVRPFSAY